MVILTVTVTQRHPKYSQVRLLVLVESMGGKTLIRDARLAAAIVRARIGNQAQPADLRLAVSPYKPVC